MILRSCILDGRYRYIEANKIERSKKSIDIVCFSAYFDDMQLDQRRELANLDHVNVKRSGRFMACVFRWLLGTFSDVCFHKRIFNTVILDKVVEKKKINVLS